MKNKTLRQQPHQLPSNIPRDLRKRSTSAEQILWKYLQNRRLNGLKFRRQYPIPNIPYVADFYCDHAKLVIELDGSIHAQQIEHDQQRQQEIEALGYRVLRFNNQQIFNQLRDVLTTIQSNC